METSLANKHEHHVPGDIFFYTTQFTDQDVIKDQSYDPLYAYKATIDPDTLYLHEAMETHDWPQFWQEMQKEIDDRMEGQNFSVIHKS